MSLAAAAVPHLPLAFGTAEIVLGLVGFIILATACNIARNRGAANATFLEWDPVDRTGFRAELDEADVHTMLAEHNRRRAEQGLSAETLEEYAERARRG